MQELEGCPWSHDGTASFDLVIFASSDSSGPAVAFIDGVFYLLHLFMSLQVTISVLRWQLLVLLNPQRPREMQEVGPHIGYPVLLLGHF